MIFILIWLASPALLFAVYGIGIAYDRWQVSRRSLTEAALSTLAR